jgi:beta-glucanase (GH16 family)
VGNGEVVLEALVSVFTFCNGPSCPGTVSPQGGDVALVGLAHGTDQNNAIAIVGFPSTNSVTCETIANGVATQIPVALSNGSLTSPDEYEIAATSGSVNFYIDGQLVATSTTNIPTTPLNALFYVSSVGSSTNYIEENLSVSDVSFKQLP